MRFLAHKARALDLLYLLKILTQHCIQIMIMSGTCFTLVLPIFNAHKKNYKFKFIKDVARFKCYLYIKYYSAFSSFLN